MSSAAFAASQHDAGTAANIGRSPLTQPPLPYAEDALAPAISAETVGLHYHKHHKGYFDKLATLIEGTPMTEMSLEEIILSTHNDASKIKIFNNAAQAWNHNFYWQSLSPKAQTPSGELAEAITRDFGSHDDMATKLAAAAADQFGSGWAWLVSQGGTLRIASTSNADLPFVHGATPLLTIDVWEHAYYLDVQNRRPDYIKAVIDGHLAWDFAAANFARA